MARAQAGIGRPPTPPASGSDSAARAVPQRASSVRPSGGDSTAGAAETVDPVAHFFKCYLAGFATVAVLVENVM